MLVGREPERRRIDALVSSARIGQSGVLVLTGEPGIGKTALLRYAAEAAVDMRVLTVTGIESERDLPFAGLASLLRLSPADLARLPEPQAQALGVALALRPGSRTDRFAVGAGTLTLLSQSSEDRPICLLVDDAHLLDGPSQEALAFVARRLLADAVALVAAARSGEPCRLVDADLPQTQLVGVGADATRELVDLELPPGSGGDLSARIHRLSGGNPLAIRELLGAADQLSTLPPDAPAPVPTALSELYARRAAELDPATRTALLVAAAVGEDLGTVSRACTRLGVGVAALAAAEEAGLIAVVEDRVHFRHPLVRSGLYATASPQRRREVHSVIADVLPDSEADRRAWHRCAATLGPDEPTALAMDEVAQRAANRSAYSVAAAAAERAASFTAADESARAARWLAAGTYAWQGGDAQRATRLLERAARLDPSAGTQATAGRIRGVIAARCGAADHARDMLMEAGRASVDPAEAIVCFAEAVSACFYLGDAAGAVAAADNIEALVARSSTPVSSLGLVAAGMGRILAGQDGAPLIRRALSRADVAEAYAVEGLDQASWRALGPMYLRDSSTGRDLIKQVADDRRAASAIGALPHLLFHIARDEAATDRWSQAEADYTEAIGLARETGQSTELAVSLAGLAWLEARQGRIDDVTAHASEALELAERYSLHIGRIWAMSALADLAHATGDITHAADQYSEIEALLHSLGLLDVDLSPIPDLVETLLRQGDQDDARALAEDYRQRAVEKGQPWALARAARGRALLSADTDVDLRFGEALELHRATLDAFEEGRTQLAYGARLRRQRRRVDARGPLNDAFETFTRLGAKPWADTTADELAATGISVTKPGQSPASQLTPRELQVASLLADGKTTRQTATALFLSPKTVEYHLRHVYLKLGIDSRSELIAQLSGAGQPS